MIQTMLGEQGIPLIMPTERWLRWRALIAAVVTTCLFAACGGGGNSGANPITPPISNSNISGTVATGAPVAGTVVTANCQANQRYTSQPTDSLGTYALAVSTPALPCIASVTLPSGEVFRSFATGTPVANITPLTELVVRRAGANPANFQQGTQETLQLLSTMHVPFVGDPTTTAFVPNGTGNDAALLKLFPRMASTLANGQSTMAFGTNLSAYERIDPSTYPAMMPLVDDPLWDAIQLGTAKAVNETFFGVGGYFSDKLDPSSQLLVEKLINYGMGVMFKEMAKKSFAKCASTDCAQKIVLALAKSLKDDATNSPTNYLKDIISNPLEIIASSVFDSIADFYEARLTDYLMSDGTLSFWDNVELVSVTYGGRVAAHTAINQFIGGKPLPLATLQAEFSVGFDFAKQDIVNLFYIAKMSYDTAKENQLTVNLFQVYLVRKNFRLDAAATYSAWLATNHTADVMSSLRAKAQAAKSETQRLAQLLPTEQKLAQSSLANSLIDQVLASYQSKVNAALLSNIAPTATFTASASTATVNQAVNFNPSGSTDSDGNIVTYAWNYGDGQSSSLNSSVIVSHAFGSVGTYVVTLTVTDNLGATNATSKSVTVSAPVGLTDTGVTASECYQAGSDVLVSCMSAAAIALNAQQDGMVGRDVTAADNNDGKLGFSYQSVGSYLLTDCVKDNITGLTWEGKTSSGLRAGSATYSNYGDGRSGDASSYVVTINATALCGYTDWRLPMVDELHSLVDYGGVYTGSAYVSAWFPNTISTAYWTSSPLVGSTNVAWFLNFYEGYVHYDYRNGSGGSFHVRLVRGVSASMAQGPYSYGPDESGTPNALVTDRKTGLTWRRCSEGQAWSNNAGTCTGLASVFTHEQALVRAKSQTGWRVPNVKELSSLADRTRANPAIDPVAFPATPVNYYWTSTPVAGSSDWAWMINFDSGYVGGNGNPRSFGGLNVRLVR